MNCNTNNFDEMSVQFVVVIIVKKKPKNIENLTFDYDFV